MSLQATDLHTYTAMVNDVHDGDTLNLVVDLGFDVSFRMNVRLLGCNARELRDPGGSEAAANLQAMLPQGTTVLIRTVKPDKFGGRYDADVATLAGVDVVALLIAQQWAAPWDGKGTKPVPPWPRTV